MAISISIPLKTGKRKLEISPETGLSGFEKAGARRQKILYLIVL
jgi:hypothetical protein